jgi:hypothetical protein
MDLNQPPIESLERKEDLTPDVLQQEKKLKSEVLEQEREPTLDVPQQAERELKTLRGIAFEYRTKVSAKSLLVGRFGESKYEGLIQDPKPHLMLTVIGESVVIVILY